MAKPDMNIILVAKKEVRKQEVLTVCLGDINGDGNKEIIFGGGSNEANGNHIYAISDVSSLDSFLFDIEIPGGYLKQGTCFDIDNDGKDEIICGNKCGKLFYIDFEDGVYKIKDLHSFPVGDGVNIIEDIQVINFERTIYIFSCSIEGNLNIIGMREGTKFLERERKFDFPVYSLNPFVINEHLHLIVGGEGQLSIFCLDQENNLTQISDLGLEQFKKNNRGVTVNEEDRIYRIITLENGPGFIKFACGFRSGKLKILQFTTELEELYGQDFDRSIYDFVADDVDSCGTKELIVVGEMHKDLGDIGFIKIYKMHDNNLTTLCERSYRKRILSVQSFFDSTSNIRYLLASGIGEALISFKIVNSEEISGLVSSLGLLISQNPKKYCFFVGAGFSFPCFPLAYELSDELIGMSGNSREAIFNFLKTNAKSKKILEDTMTPEDPIPLEAVLYWYKIHRDRESMIQLLMRTFDNSSMIIPKHITILGKLLKTNLIDYVFSVNYDVLLERSTSEIDSLIKDEEFISRNICFKKGILKLHGSVTKPESIEGSLDEVGEFKGRKKTTLDFLFNGHTIIFIGYSCRDPDLFPALKEIVGKYGTSCYFVDPIELSEQAKEILEISGQTDIRPRHFQISADSFFEYLASKIDIGMNEGVSKTQREVT